MTIRIPDTVFEGLGKWMVRGPWPDYLQEALDDHMGAYCERHEIDSFEKLAEKIGGHWVSVLNDMALNDFLGRETEDGNVVDLYLKRRGWREKKITSAYLKGIRDSAVSLYEVSDIRPGESFLARDLIMGGEPIRVSERSATKTMSPWEQFAMRIVEVRGHHIMAGGLLPFEPDLAAEVIEEIQDLMERAEARAGEALHEADADLGDEISLKDLPPEALRMFAVIGTLKMASPLIAETWMMGTVLDPADAPLPQLFNSDGDEVEFIKLTCRFAKGTTQAKIRAILDAEPDMAPASAKIWNWVDRGRKPGRPDRKRKALPEGRQMYKSELEDGSLVLGMITLKGRTLEADTNSTRRAEELKTRLANLLGDLVLPPLTMHQTLEQAMAEHRENGPTQAPLDLPPEEEARLMAELFDQHYRDTLDQPIGMLNEQTPRETVKTAAGREQVAAWLKYLEQGEAKARSGKDIPPYDFSWMWKELGIGELRK